MTNHSETDTLVQIEPGESARVFGLESRWLELPGERIHYHEQGAGSPVILIHGSAVGVSAAANWFATIPALASRAHVFALDLAGYGFTEVDEDAEFGLGVWTEQVVRFMAALDLKSAVLIGNSLGGRIGLQVAIDHPELVLGLITMGSPGLEHKRTAVVDSHVRPTFSREGIGRVMQNMVADPEHIDPRIVDFRFRLAARPGGPERWAKVVKARDESVAAAGLTAEQVAGVTIPAFIVHGREDKVVHIDDSLAVAKAMPHADLVVLSNCGHWAQIERASEFITLAVSLLDRVDASA